MLITIPEVLTAQQITQCRKIIDAGPWKDGRITAGTQAEQVKNNLQLPEDCAEALEARQMVVQALNQHGLFFTAALPKKVFPPLFNRYEGGSNSFGNHIDNAVRTSISSGAWVRTDLSATLFLSAPDSYDGGELIVEDRFGSQSIKLAAGDMILYPSSSVHRVEAVTRGARVACFFWVESMVRDDAQRSILFDLDTAILSLRQQHGESADTIRLTGCYHNLLRLWADV